jgi:hypothetical protein
MIDDAERKLLIHFFVDSVRGKIARGVMEIEGKARNLFTTISGVFQNILIKTRNFL